MESTVLSKDSDGETSSVEQEEDFTYDDDDDDDNGNDPDDDTDLNLNSSAKEEETDDDHDDEGNINENAKKKKKEKKGMIEVKDLGKKSSRKDYLKSEEPRIRSTLKSPYRKKSSRNEPGEPRIRSTMKSSYRKKSARKDGLRASTGLSNKSSDTSRKVYKKPQSKKGKKARFFGDTEDTVEKEQEIPDGLIPIFLTIRTQEHFGLMIDEDVTIQDPQKFILKRDILQDLEEFGDKSDFAIISKMIKDYPAAEFLVVYDHEFKYGQNFFITVSEDARNMFVKDSVTSDIEDYSTEFIGPYELPQPQEWVCRGSDKEIQDWTVVNERDYIKMLFRRDVKYFRGPIEFSDSNPVDSKNFIDIMPSINGDQELRRMEVDVGVQAVQTIISTFVEKIQGLPASKIVQCMPREMSEEEAQDIMESVELSMFFNKITLRLDKELQQNKIFDVFFDDWNKLCDGDTNFAAKSEKHIKEYQSFTDLQHGKSRAISYITWHPTIPSIIAVSLIDNISLYERLEQAFKQLIIPLILIWNFSDPIHPILSLECPDQVMCFQFCPTNPSFVVGGCFNGQVVMWDITQYSDRLKVLPSIKKKDILRELSAEFDWAKVQSTVRYCAISSMEHSHSLPVTDLVWMPNQYEINKFGYVSYNKSEQNIQLITCSLDQSIMFWDIRMSNRMLPVSSALKKDKELCLTPLTFKHLDLVWRPFLKLSTSKAEIGYDYSPTRCSITEVPVEISKASMDHSGTGTNTPKPISSKFFVGTEEGEIIYMDWTPQKDQESGKYQTQRPIFCHQIHNGPVLSLKRSPFFEDILLSVGGWNFALWKEGINLGPIFMGFNSKRFTFGSWSSTRPAVIYLSKVDGTIDVWDLLDRTHEACYTQNISTSQLNFITNIRIKKTLHLIAVGDENGTLYLLELPWSLSNPSLNENANMEAFLDKEVQHLAYVNSRWAIRDEERLRQDLESKRLKNMIEPSPPTEEELEVRERHEYELFLEEEIIFLKQMGLMEEPPVVLPPPPPPPLVVSDGSNIVYS